MLPPAEFEQQYFMRQGLSRKLESVHNLTLCRKQHSNSAHPA